MTDDACINWSYAGIPDPLFGTGSTRAERALVLLPAGLAAAAFVMLGCQDAFGWMWWQYVVAGVVAADVMGGVVANGLNSCKRFYHRPSEAAEPPYIGWLRRGINFELLHIYPILISALFSRISFWAGVGWYAGMVGSAVIVRRAPLYLKRPVALLCIAMAIGWHALFPLGDGLNWLVPLLFLKLVYGHQVREEPYRPCWEADGDSGPRLADDPLPKDS
jgi:hypothetical protein